MGVGIAIVAASVVAGARVIGAADDAVTVWAATGDLAPVAALEPDDLVRRGHPEIIVAEVVRMVDRAEYKRRQGPVGIKITPRAFGRDRRMPITTRHV